MIGRHHLAESPFEGAWMDRTYWLESEYGEWDDLGRGIWRLVGRSLTVSSIRNCTSGLRKAFVAHLHRLTLSRMRFVDILTDDRPHVLGRSNFNRFFPEKLDRSPLHYYDSPTCSL